VVSSVDNGSRPPLSDDSAAHAPDTTPVLRPASTARPDPAAAPREARADARDRAADERDRAADERDREADRRETEANQREQQADDRERRADAREAALDRLASARGVPPSELLARSDATLRRACEAVIRADGRVARWEAEARRRRLQLDRGHQELRYDNAEVTLRAWKVTEDARRLATWLADAADEVATTLDHVADTREKRATQVQGLESDRRRESARRARAKADAERRESREIRQRFC
jgi:hypothetical protein